MWRFEALEDGHEDPFLSTHFTGFEASAKVRLQEFHRQIRRIYPAKTLITRMTSVGQRPVMGMRGVALRGVRP